MSNLDKLFNYVLV